MGYNFNHNQLGVIMTKEQLIIEGIARMDQDERDQLVSKLVETYPTLADGLMSSIGFALMEQERVDEQLALHA
jgi:hypothetical protein